LSPRPLSLPFGQLEAGTSAHLGATWDGGGVNFALFSAHATAVELCVYEPDAIHEIVRLPLAECTDHVWHGYLPGARPGLLYGYRVHGPYDPELGHRFNPHKLLLDPYAKGYAGSFRWTDAHCGYRVGPPRGGRGDLSFDRRDNAWALPKCRVVDAATDWGDDRRPSTSLADTVILEAHAKGFTMLDPAIPEALRGTYAGLAHPAAVAKLQRLGITALELLPVHELVDERALVNSGLVNYWGYNTIGFFAPATRYAGPASTGRSDPLVEFRAMVRALHAAGIEVILDVVYNHTAEGDEFGPTLSFRGIDNCSYYRLKHDARRWYDDVTGCGNTLNVAHPRVQQLVLDSLRWWVTAMHVDGFRFDLATALAREGGGFDPGCAFLDALRQDPVLRTVKLIAEPWDVATWETGRFPAGIAEWNDRFRDAVRSFWLTGAASAGDLARRLTASSDLFRHDGRMPQASINFVTAHDGFTAADVVSYLHKHNEANGQTNADGTNDNRSVNCGVEGPTDDRAILARRKRLVRALLATLLVAQGTPMLTAGDAEGRTQNGNNNAYCQDNATSWLDWETADAGLQAFVARLIALRRAHPALRRRRWFDGVPTPAGDRDLMWLFSDGSEMTPARWEDATVRAFGCLFGRYEPNEAAVLVLVNGGNVDVPFVLPAGYGAWRVAIDTARPGAAIDMTWPSTAARTAQPEPAVGQRRSDPADGSVVPPVVVPEHALLVLIAEGASA